MKIGIIGTGNMGLALMEAFRLDESNAMTASNRSREKLLAACDKTGAIPAASNVDAIRDAEVILLAVKPMYMGIVLQEIAPYVTKDQIIVTLAVGLTLASYEEILGPDKKIIRSMPNTPAAVQAGMTAFCPNGNVTEVEMDSVRKLFSLAGETVVLPEHLMNAVSALTGSSPAYVYMFIEAMADGGCYVGIPRQDAYKMAAQAVLGSAKMVLETGKHPGQLKDEVCSPGGTTIRAVAALEKGGMRGSVIEAIRACTEAANNQ